MAPVADFFEDFEEVRSKTDDMEEGVGDAIDAEEGTGDVLDAESGDVTAPIVAKEDVADVSFL